MTMFVIIGIYLIFNDFPVIGIFLVLYGCGYLR